MSEIVLDRHKSFSAQLSVGSDQLVNVGRRKLNPVCGRSGRWRNLGCRCGCHRFGRASRPDLELFPAIPHGFLVRFVCLDNGNFPGRRRRHHVTHADVAAHEERHRQQDQEDDKHEAAFAEATGFSFLRRWFDPGRHNLRRIIFSQSFLGDHQFVVEPAQSFREQARPGQHRHEIRVAIPPRDNVKM